MGKIMKNLKFLVFALLTFFVVSNVNAEETIKELNELKACLSSDVVVCTLGANIAVDDSLFVNGSNVTLDLNGYTISLDEDTYENAIIVVEHGGKLTIKDSSATKTGKISYITDLTTKKVRTAIKLTKSKGDNTKTAELIVDGGTLEGDSYAISGNGLDKRDNTKTTINGGKLYSKNTAIFQPQDGKLIVNGGTIEGKTGIEVRSGDLTVNGGTIIGTEKPTENHKNSNGTTTTGAGIAVVQHTTVKDINVFIKGGTIKGYTAFYQTSVENNSDSTKVNLDITGGNFVIINDGEDALYSSDKEAFVTGGTFDSKIPESYLKDSKSYKVVETDGKYVVYEKHNVRFAKIENGEVTVDTDYAAYGDEVILTLKPNEGYELNKISVVANDNTVVEVKNNKFVMPDDEVAIIVTFSPIQKAETPVIGKDTEIGVEDAKETEEILLETISNNDDYKDKTVTVKVEVEDIKATTEVSKEFTEALKEAKLSDAKVLNFFDITIAVKNAITGAKLGVLPVLSKEITFAVEIPSDVEEVKEGYTRNYYIIRKHGEDIEIIKDVKVSKDGKYLTFDTNKFSTYALAYEDTVKENNNIEVPKTGDSVVLYVTLGFVSIVAIGITLNDLKKRTSR